MDSKAQAKYEVRARIIKAIAHPTRLFIVDELARCDERCVCELTEMIGADMSTVSRHLAMLKNVGIIEDEKRGAQVFYSLRCRCATDFLDCVESVIRSNARGQRKLWAS
ncbi:MAG: helix-turn-helix transcriptional regulator [Pirellulaceae bacterium]|nr:helix-turn-helix transcriptional regulator [Pirellulaceae bacterium]